MPRAPSFPLRSRRLFRATAFAAVVLVAGSLAGCGSGKRVERDGNGNVIPSIADQDPIASLYAQSINEADSGKACSDETLQVLTCFAYRGRGYEEAQYALGECIITAKGDVPTALTWMKRGAEGGNAQAQQSLAQLYAEGKLVSRNLKAAAFWNELYIHNPSLLTLGAVPDGRLADKLSRELSPDEIKPIQQQAQAFTPVYWAPASALDQKTAETCSRVQGVPKGFKAPILNPAVQQAPDYPTGN